MSYDSDVVSATSGVGDADWDKIIKLCNRIRESVGPTSMHQAMQSVMKRVRHSSPAVQIHALTLLEACVSNCGQDFQKELTTPAFQGEVRSLLLGPYSDPRVTHKLKELLVNWSAEFKSALHMRDLLKFIEQLRREGINFAGPQVSALVPSHTQHTSTSSQAQNTRAREDEDLRKAIQLSLQENTSTPPSSSSSSSAPVSSASSSSRPAKKETKKVRAIYDFHAAEDNELSFRAGEIITLLDDSDENWWRGETQLSQGLFPASFVSKNLNKDPEPSKHEKKSKKTTKSDEVVLAAGKTVGEVNEQKVDLLLDMLKSADVTDTSREESKTVKELESEVQAMRPVVGQAIQQLTAHEEAMQSVSKQFNEALALYRKLLAEGPRLSDIAQPPVVQSVQHGMTTHETHAVNPVPPQPHHGMGTQQFHQNGIRAHPQQNGMQLHTARSVFQPSIQPQHGMGMQVQHGMAPVQQPGMRTQPALATGMAVPQTGTTIPPQNGIGTQHQSTVYSSSAGHYVPNELVSREVGLQPAPSLQYQPQQSLSMVQPQPLQHSSYAPPYQPPSLTTQLHMPTAHPPPSLPPPPPYHTSLPQATQILQPLL